MNDCGQSRGGVEHFGDSLTIVGSILAGNTAAAGAADFDNSYDLPLAANFCLIGDGTGSSLSNGVNNNRVGTTGAPLNSLLAPLANYGAGTQTMALRPGSPAIDAGGAATFAADQRGFPCGTTDGSAIFHR